MGSAYRDGVFRHERGTRQQVVHQGLVLEVAVEATMIAQAVPRFDADEGSVFSKRTPESADGRLVIHGHSWLAIGVH